MKNILIGAVLLLCFLHSKAQSPAPSAVSAAAPTTPPPAKAEFKLIFEKAYLHTDRDVYAQGDTLWFKAYLINGQNNKPAYSSGNLYVELIAPDSGKIVSREIVRLDNGIGNGDMELLDSLPAGKYKLRAYTNWMRNFGDNFIFNTDITILNTQAAPVDVTQKTASATTPKAHTPATALTATSGQANIIRFYPEGGSLVEGISSIVAVKAEDGYGKGIPVNGSILSSAGDTVSRFSCDTLGMGLFAMLPVGGQTYHAVATFTGSGSKQPVPPATFNLPAALSKGPTLAIRQTDSLIRAIVSTNDTLPAKPVYIITVKHAGSTLLNQQLQIKGPQISAGIPSASLPEGISAITLYDATGKPECERLVYVHHSNTAKPTVITSKKIYQSKEQVTVSINTHSDADLSMAVVDAGIVPEQADDIASYLYLQSEVKGNIEHAHRYFDTTNVNRVKQLNLLLLTQGWRDFVWRRLADTAIRISYAAENGIIVSGRVRDEVLNKLMPGLNVSLYATGAKGTKMFSAVTDSSGRFSFSGLMLYGQQPVKLGALNDKGQEKGSFMLDTLMPLPVPRMISNPKDQGNSTDSVAEAAVEKRVAAIKNAHIGGITKLKEVSIRAKNNVVTRSGNMLTTFGPDQSFTIKPEDEKYKTLEWYMLQNVKGAFQGLGNYTGVVFRGIDTAKQTMPSFSGTRSAYIGKNVIIPPIIFVNGQELYMDEPTQAETYRNTYFNMPITKIKKIVLKRMTGTLHGLSAAGTTLDPSAETVSVDRYLLYLTMDENAMIDNPGSLSKTVTGYYEARNFYKPLPNARPSLADYRTTIHWEPNIKTDATGKATVIFNNAVPQTAIRVIVQGLTANGEPVSATATYQTK